MIVVNVSLCQALVMDFLQLYSAIQPFQPGFPGRCSPIYSLFPLPFFKLGDLFFCECSVFFFRQLTSARGNLWFP